MKVIKSAVLGTVKFYKNFISPSFGSNCRFYPSCSSYTHQAVEKYGTFKGLQKGFWRILKCNPFNKGGIDLP
jgi:putative membrane protein insertion efficiency factor